MSAAHATPINRAPGRSRVRCGARRAKNDLIAKHERRSRVAEMLRHTYADAAYAGVGICARSAYTYTGGQRAGRQYRLSEGRCTC